MKKYDIFLSHSSADKELVRIFHQHWECLGAQVFLDERKLSHGVLARNLQEAIRESHKVVLVVSEKAIQSRWVQWERQHAEWDDVIAVKLDAIDFLELGKQDPTWIPFAAMLVTDLSDPTKYVDQWSRLTEQVMIPILQRKEEQLLKEQKERRKLDLLELEAERQLNRDQAQRNRRNRWIMVSVGGAALVSMLGLFLFEKFRPKVPMEPEAAGLVAAAIKANSGVLVDSAVITVRVSRAGGGKYNVSMKTDYLVRALKDGPIAFREEYNSGNVDHRFENWLSTHDFKKALPQADTKLYKTEFLLNRGQSEVIVTGRDLLVTGLGRAEAGETIGGTVIPPGHRSYTWTNPGGYHVNHVTIMVYSDSEGIDLKPFQILREDLNQPVDSLYYSTGARKEGMNLSEFKRQGFFEAVIGTWNRVYPETQVGIIYQATDTNP